MYPVGFGFDRIEYYYYCFLIVSVYGLMRTDRRNNVQSESYSHYTTPVILRVIILCRQKYIYILPTRVPTTI